MKAAGVHLGHAQHHVSYLDDAGTPVRIPDVFEGPLSSGVLRQTREAVERASGDLVGWIVVAVPAHLDATARRETYEAGIEAFFAGDKEAAKGRLEVISAPEAALVEFPNGQSVIRSLALVATFEGERLDLAVMENVDSGRWTVLRLGTASLEREDLEVRIAELADPSSLDLLLFLGISLPTPGADVRSKEFWRRARGADIHVIADGAARVAGELRSPASAEPFRLFCLGVEGSVSLPQFPVIPRARPDALFAAHSELISGANIHFSAEITQAAFQGFVPSGNAAPAAAEGDFGIPRSLGHFKIIKVIGQGGFSVVCLAEDTTSFLGQQVALKIPMRQRLEKDERWVDMIRREATLWRSLSVHRHPNILELYDLKRIDGFTFFVTEYMDGGNVEEASRELPEDGRVRAAANLLPAIAEGLAFTHRQGKIHGDVKPQNILISVDWTRCKLGDFGLSTLESDVPAGEELRVAGTVMFLAPESFEGQKTPQTDIFALGVTLFSLLTGEYPFEARWDGRDFSPLRAERTAFRAGEVLKAKVSTVPSWLMELVERALAPNPHDRFRDGAELLEFIIPHVDPSRRRVVLTVGWNAEGETLDYDIEIDGQRRREMLTVEITHGTINDLCAQADCLGELALERSAASGTTAAVDRQIRDLLSAIANDGSDFVLGPQVKRVLGSLGKSTVWLHHNPRVGAIPWELLNAGDTHLCRTAPMARWSKLLTSAPALAGFRRDEAIRVLILCDPGGNLPGAQDECRRIERVFQRSDVANRLELDWADESVGSFSLRRKMRQCHILHYAGHGVFPARGGDLMQSGWLLKGDPERRATWDDLLRASALGDLWKEMPPRIVFANACVSGKISPELTRRRGLPTTLARSGTRRTTKRQLTLPRSSIESSSRVA